MALTIWLADVERACDGEGLVVPQCLAGRLACTPAEVARAFIGYPDVLRELLMWVPFDDDDVRELQELSGSLFSKEFQVGGCGVWASAVRESEMGVCHSIIEVCVARQSPQSGYKIF